MKREDMRSERGVLVIEATFVYPIMFFVIFFLIYMGNMFFLKSDIERIVNEVSIEAASYYGDPLLQQIEANGSLQVDNISIKPYRYVNVFSNGEDIDDSEAEIRAAINNTGFFAGMTPKVVDVDPHIHNYVIYQTYEVNVEYKLEFPIRFLFQDDYMALDCTVHAEVPVVDNAEFIRNVDMVIDYIQHSETGQKAIEGITKAIGKLNDFINPQEGGGES